MRNLNDQIIMIRFQMKEKERLENLLKRADDHAKTLKIKQNELSQQLQKENLDVEQLEGLSIASIFHTILGHKAERLEKEKQEAISAKLKYDAACEELMSVGKEMADLQQKLNEFWDLESKYYQLIEEKEQFLLTTSSEVISILDSVTEQKAVLMHHRRELGEAMTAGHSLLSSLQQVMESLKSANNWGRLDILGGGLLSTVVKHSKIDEAKQKIDRAQSLLNKFHRELQDVGGVIHVGDLEIGGFLTFADYFFDGFLADLSVQSRINEAQNKVEDTISKVKQIITNLSVQLAETAQEEERVERERLAMIEKA